MSKLDGRVAVVIGGSSGIGLATARLFAEEGARVFITGRRQAELDMAVAAIGGAVMAVQGDVAVTADLDRLFARVREESGGLDILVLSAGAVELKTIEEASEGHFDRIFGINVRGAFFAVQKALPLFNDGGSIVLIGSSGHLVGIPQYTAYSASKAALRSFARSWAATLAPRRIRVNTLSPGPVETPLIDAQVKSPEEGEQLRTMLKQLIPLGRMGTPEEIARSALFLASDDSSYSTGIDLLADGGQTQL